MDTQEYLYIEDRREATKEIEKMENQNGEPNDIILQK